MTKEERIAARLVAAIEPLLPAWCAISIDGDELHMFVDGRWEVSVALWTGDREADLARNVLNTIQDAVVRTSTTPWPAATDPTDLPIPEATVRSGQLLAWYGPENGPTVTLPPIDLATV